MTATLQSVPREGWDATLLEDGLTDVFLRRGTSQASAVLDEGEPTLLVLRAASGGVAFPFLLREVPGEPGLSDVITPYGFGGPIGFGADPPWAGFHEAYERWCEEHRVVTTFVRFHPLYANQVDASPSMDVVPLAGTVGWRLEPGADLMDGITSKHRRKIRAAERAGLTVGLDEDRSGGAPGLATLRRLYEETIDPQRGFELLLLPGRVLGHAPHRARAGAAGGAGPRAGWGRDGGGALLRRAAVVALPYPGVVGGGTRRERDLPAVLRTGEACAGRWVHRVPHRWRRRWCR